MIFQFGIIKEPTALENFGAIKGGGGIGNFLNIIIGLLIVGAGIYAFFNFILAGYAFMGAGGDPKKMEMAWAKIWQSVIGLLIVAGSFVLASIFGGLIFGDWSAIVNPTIPTLK